MSERAPIRLREAEGLFPPVKVHGQVRAPLDDLYHLLLTLRWSAFFVVVGLIYVGTNALFALVYWAVPGSIANASGSFEDAFFFSVQTMATIGYGGMAPAGRFGNVMVTVEAVVGMIGVALVTGITFAKFARPEAKVLFAEKMVVAPRDGRPHLCVRIANWRHNQVVDVQIKLLVIRLFRTAEGEVMRRPVEMRLVRPNAAFFRLTWVAMHEIDEDSPLHGGLAALEALRGESSLFYVTVSGFDVTMMQPVHASYTYAVDDLLVGARYADVMTDLPDGSRLIDYTRFHDTLPAPLPPGSGWG